MAGPLLNPTEYLIYHGGRQVHRTRARYFRNICDWGKLHRHKKGINQENGSSVQIFTQECTQGLNATARRNEAYEDPSEYHYLQQPLWWAGILLRTF